MFSKILVGYSGEESSEDPLLFARLLGQLEQEAVTAVCVYGYRRSTRMNIRTGEFAGTLSRPSARSPHCAIAASAMGSRLGPWADYRRRARR